MNFRRTSEASPSDDADVSKLLNDEISLPGRC